MISRSIVVVCLVISVVGGVRALAQQDQTPTLRLGGVRPGGVRSTVTTSWGMFDVDVANFTDIDRKARVLVFYKDQPRLQYGRDVWVPAHSSLKTWMLVGPAPANLPGMTCELEMLIEDRTAGRGELLSPSTDERVRSRGERYRRREPYTTILLDAEADEKTIPGQLPQPDSPNAEAITLAHVFRHSRNLSLTVPSLDPDLLPASAEAFDGIDHFILASERLARDPVGMTALRHWTEQGGKVWVMLDRVEPDVLAPLLGDALDFQVIDRVGLTSFRVETHPAGKGMETPPLQQRDRPVDFVRVQLPPRERVRHTIDGWPVWFTRGLGRGEVVFTTLGPRGWYRSRRQGESPSPYPDYPRFPVTSSYLDDLGVALQPSGKESSFGVEALQPLLAAEIGYSVPRIGTVVLIFAGALLGSLVLGLVLRRSSRPELLGWLGPAAALAATAAFLIVGERARREVPATVATAQIIEPVFGKEEAAIHGLMEVYRPQTGTIEASAERGGFFQLDDRDMPEQIHQFILTDTDAWHWERFALLAEPRLASFHITLPTDRPIAALGRFGPNGLEGNLSGPLQNLSDALLSTPGGRRLAVHIESDGAFRADAADVLPRGQYLAGTVLSDRQQRRQDVYAAFLKEPEPASVRGRNVLLAWADPLETHFHIVPGAQTTGTALVVAPLRLERPPLGQRVTLPGPFLPYQRVLDGVATRPPLESSESVEMHLRFQLPPEVLPFQVQRARFAAKIEAPGRRVLLAGWDGGQLTEVHRVDSPLDPLRIEIAEEKLLHVDADGGVHLNLTVGRASGEEAPRAGMPGPRPRGGEFKSRPPRAKLDDLGEKWTIHYLELEVSGQAVAENR